jgi:subtilisin family serine protease
MNGSEDWRDRRKKAVERELQRSGAPGLLLQRTGEGFLYRPGELLLGRRAVDVLRRTVDRDSVRDDEEMNARFAHRDVDVQRWTVRPDYDVTAIQQEIDGEVRTVGSHVALNHVFAGEWYYSGGPATAPQLAAEIAQVGPNEPDSTDAALAILDTGVTSPVNAFFAPILLDEDGTDIDYLNEDGDAFLDTEAGHGTFICGLVRRLVPDLGIQQRRVLNSNGFGDDLSVAIGVAETDAPVLNLSLGGYTTGDRTPKALKIALSSLSPDRVVVAAAGNNSRQRKFWPAAFHEVIAVAAYDPATNEPAGFSNHGDWVDVCAPGVNLHSSFVHGRRGDGKDDPTFNGWAAWSGTSFAAPLVAAEIARRTVESSKPASQVAQELLEELGPKPRDGYGRRFTPSKDLHVEVADASRSASV